MEINIEKVNEIVPATSNQAYSLFVDGYQLTIEQAASKLNLDRQYFKKEVLRRIKHMRIDSNDRFYLKSKGCIKKDCRKEVFVDKQSLQEFAYKNYRVSEFYKRIELEEFNAIKGYSQLMEKYGAVDTKTRIKLATDVVNKREYEHDTIIELKDILDQLNVDFNKEFECYSLKQLNKKFGVGNDIQTYRLLDSIYFYFRLKLDKSTVRYILTSNDLKNLGEKDVTRETRGIIKNSVSVNMAVFQYKEMVSDFLNLNGSTMKFKETKVRVMEDILETADSQEVTDAFIKLKEKSKKKNKDEDKTLD